MASTTMEAPRAKGEEPKSAKDAKGEAGGESSEAKAAPAPTPGGFKAWLPLLVAIVTMPALAYATTKFILLPKLEHSISGGAKAGAAPAEAAATETASKEGGKGGAAGKGKVNVPMSKLLVNVAGTMGTRYLMTSITLVGNTPEFKNKIEDNKDQLMDLASSTLSSKTISDLEKPGARNVIRTELITVFNNALGGPLVQEIYITEMAIQ